MWLGYVRSLFICWRRARRKLVVLCSLIKILRRPSVVVSDNYMIIFTYYTYKKLYSYLWDQDPISSSDHTSSLATITNGGPTPLRIVSGREKAAVKSSLGSHRTAEGRQNLPCIYGDRVPRHHLNTKVDGSGQCSNNFRVPKSHEKPRHRTDTQCREGWRLGSHKDPSTRQEGVHQGLLWNPEEGSRRIRP